MSALFALSIAFIVIDLIIVVAGIIIGFLRGAGQSLVRLVYLTAIGIISFFTARAIAFEAAPKILSAVILRLPADIQDLLISAPRAVTILENLAGAILSTLFITVIFGILQALSMICFDTISRKLVGAIYKKEEHAAGKWIGAAVGLVSGILVSAVLLSPVFTVLNVADNLLPDTAVTVFEYDSEEKAKNALRVTKAFPLNKAVASAITSYDVPYSVPNDDKKDNALKALPVIIDVAGDASGVFNATKEYGGNTKDATSNAIATAIPHIDRSVTLRRLAVEMLVSMSKTLKDGGYVMGINFAHSDNALIEDVRPALIDAIMNTQDINVKENMITLFGDMNKTIVLQNDGSIAVVGSYIDSLKTNCHNNGLIAVMNELNNHGSDGLPHEDTEIASELALAVRHMSNNDNMDEVLHEIKLHVTDPLAEQGIDIYNEIYTPIYADIADSLSTVIEDNTANETVNIEEVAADVEIELDTIFDTYSLPFDKTETSILATCVAKEFSSEEYVTDNEVNITADDILNFFRSEE